MSRSARRVSHTSTARWPRAIVVVLRTSPHQWGWPTQTDRSGGSSRIRQRRLGQATASTPVPGRSSRLLFAWRPMAGIGARFVETQLRTPECGTPALGTSDGRRPHGLSRDCRVCASRQPPVGFRPAVVTVSCGPNPTASTPARRAPSGRLPHPAGPRPLPECPGTPPRAGASSPGLHGHQDGRRRPATPQSRKGSRCLALRHAGASSRSRSARSGPLQCQ